MVVWDQVPFPYTDANAQRPEWVGSRPAAGVRFLVSYSTLGTACAVVSRTVGVPVLAAGTRPYIDVMHGPPRPLPTGYYPSPTQHASSCTVADETRCLSRLSAVRGTTKIRRMVLGYRLCFT